MEGYSVLTGMWACDIVNSKAINDDKKATLVTKINKYIKEVKLITNSEFITEEFRGDGYLIVFSEKNAKRKVYEFGEAICKYFSEKVEDNEIEEILKLRTYIQLGEVFINEKKEVTGSDVDEFCQLVDNKFQEPYQIPQKYNVALIVSDQWEDILKSKQNYTKILLDGKNYYNIGWENRNIKFKIEFVNYIKQGFDDVHNILDAISKKYNIKIFQMDQLNYFSISGNNEDDNIFDFFVDISDKLYANFCKQKNKYVIISLDLENNDRSIFDTNLIDFFNDKIHISDYFKSYLVWSDICLDRFRQNKQYEKRKKRYKKLPLTSEMRAYYEDFNNDKKNNKPVITYSQIKETRIYLHSFDYCVQKSITSTSLNIDMDKHLSQQLEIALLLSDNVIIHSAEILRNELVYKILYKYRNLIKDGSISLLFSSKVNDITRDFYEYLEEKIREYSMSEYGEEEAESLREALKKDYYKKALNLIELSPYLIKRDIDGTNTLEDLINKDFYDKNDMLILNDNKLNDPDILVSNYSIRQLLFVKQITENGIQDLLTKDVKDEIVSIIDRLVNGVISASIIKCVIEKNIPIIIKKRYNKWYQALINRINFLYAQVNSGNNLYMEFLPARLKNGLFDISTFYKLFAEHLSVDGLLGPDIIINIRKKHEWSQFKLHYYAYRAKEKEMITSGISNYDANIDYNAKKQLKEIVEEITI